MSNFEADSRWRSWALGRDTSNLMHQYLAEFLLPQTWQDLALVAVAKGPGGFTGTRIGVVTARTLAQQLDIPLFAISTLAAIAHTTAIQHPDILQIAVEMPAQRGEVYGAIYQVDATERSQLTPLLLDTVMSLADWQQTLANWSKPYYLTQISGGLGDSVSSVLALAFAEWQQGKRPNWSEALPFYGQHPVDK
ncbi:MAG: tRNA (adenosine(37)-N6)-threonylcarbamoyltransferase complex dimerization subunit type 1 TsaB [Pantanalinema sp. GBBB05]|nr:tRNA (adenosine(37)-N6)-threonylcarbamoyltransferase complex dimerization subunit type 1 TsaB [Pantanalinema sp. GBBB05]